MSNKIRLKEIIEGKNIKDLEVYNAQQQTQKKHLIKNQILFEQLTTTLTHRPLTFAKCAFKKAEVEADDQLRPIVKGIYEHKTSGSMLTSDFWSNKQMRKYLKQTELLQSQRVLKRFAHWEWDYNSNKDRFRELSEKFKESIYTQQSEMNTKFKLSSNQGEKRLRKKIIRDWTSEKKIDIKDKLMDFKNNDLPKVKLPVKSVTVHSSGAKSNNEIICKMINDMDSLHYELKKERKSLSKILYKINDNDEILSVVADIGQLYLKSGFTGDDCPRYCTFSKCTESFQFGDEYLGVKPNQNIYDVLLPFNPDLYEKCVDAIYKGIQPQLKGMDAQPKELSLLLANNFQTKADLQKVMERIFENLSIPNFFTVRNPVLSTFSAGRSSALVLDIGAYQSQAAAVHEGYTLIKQTVTAPIGGEQLNDLLIPHVPASLLVGKDPTSIFKQNNQLRDIKEALIGFDGQGAVTKYDLQDGNSIQLSTSDTIEIAEKLFQHKDNFKGIDHMLIDVVNSSLADLKSQLCGSVLVTGGSSAIPGLMNKLNNKLQPLAPSLCKIKLIQYPSTQNRQHSVFIGGSILASLSSFQSMWIGKGEYQEQGLSCLDRKCPM